MYLFARLVSRKPQVLATLLVFSLSAGVLGGILFFMDSTSTDVLEDMREEIAVDMEIHFTRSFYNSYGISREDIDGIVQSQEEVTASEIVLQIDNYDYFISDDRYRRSTCLGIDHSFFESFHNVIQNMSGNGILSNDWCYLEVTTMERLSLEVGDKFNLSILFFDEWYKPVRMNASYIIAGSFTTTAFYDYYPTYDEAITSLQLLVERSQLLEDFDLLINGGYSGIKDGIWATISDTILKEGDVESIRTHLANVKKRIEQSSLPYAVVAEYGISNIVNSYSTWSSAMVTVALAFSIPSLVMGVMLVQYQSNLLSEERRKDVGTLITRGSSGWQAFNWVISTALVTACIGSVGAIITGLLASTLSASVREAMTFELYRASTYSFRILPTSIALVFFFSFVVGILISLPAAIKALLISPTEAHAAVERQDTMKQEKMGNPILEMTAGCIAIVLLIPMLSLFHSSGFLGISNISNAILFILLIGTMIIAIARILSRPAANFKARILERWGERTRTVGSQIIARNLLVFRKTEATGAFFVAMVFTAGLFSAIASTTGTNHMKDLVRFEAGADICLEVRTGLSNVTIDTVIEINNIEGVEAASGMLTTTAFLTYLAKGEGGLTSINRSIRLYGVEPNRWGDSAHWKDYYALSRNPVASLEQLEDNSSRIISSFRPLWDVSESGPIYTSNLTVEIRTPWQNYSKACSVIDVFATDENAGGNTYLPGQPDATDFIIMNIAYIHSCINSTRIERIYVNIESNADYARITEEISNVAPYSFTNIKTSDQIIDTILDSRTSQSIQGVYTLNMVFSMIYLTIGLTIVSTVKSRNLRKQYSVLRALGARERSIMESTLMDSVIGLFFSAAIGLLLGLALTLIVLQIPLVYTGLSTSVVWNRLPVLLSIPITLISGILGLAFLFTSGSTFAVTRHSLSKNIAEEIQHSE